jgi:hypothetical protein
LNRERNPEDIFEQKSTKPTEDQSFMSEADHRVSIPNAPLILSFASFCSNLRLPFDVVGDQFGVGRKP